MSRIYRRKPEGSWYWDGNVDGRRVQQSLKTRSKRLALEVKRELDKDATLRRLGLGRKRVHLVDFIQDYLTYGETNNKSPKTISLDRDALCGLLDVVGNITLDRIGPQLIERWKTEQLRRVKAITVNRKLRHLKAAFSKALEWDFVQLSPFRRVKPIRIDEATPVVLSQGDVEILFQHLREDAKTPVWIALYTGMRLGEIVNLYWTDIDLDRRLIHIVNRGEEFHTKSRREGVAAISDFLYGILKQTPKSGLRLWPWKADALSKTFKKAVRRAGLPEAIHFHSLRHTFITDLANAGVPLWDIQQAARHSNISVTEGYAHFRMERLHEIAAKVDYRCKSGAE